MTKFKEKKKVKPCVRPKKTAHSTNDNLMFWEIPLGMGCDNPKYGNKKLYWDAIQGEKFDVFILVTRNYVKGLMTWFSRELQKRNVPHFIVRTSIDESINSSKSKYPLSHNADRIQKSAMNLIINSYLENGGTLNEKFTKNQNFFVVDNYNTSEYDMPNLVDGILNNSCEGVKNSIAMSMPAKSNSIITTKMKVLKNRIWLIALESAAAGAKIRNTENIYCDFKMLKEEISLYKKQLNISDAILETVRDYDDPLAGLNDIKYNNTVLYTMLEASQSKQQPDQFIHQIKNVSFRWWLQHQKACPSFVTVSGILKFLLLNFEDLSRRMLDINKVDTLNECVV